MSAECRGGGAVLSEHGGGRGGGGGFAERAVRSRSGGQNGSGGAVPCPAVPRASPSTLYCVSVCGAYAATSVVITFANKIVLSTYGFGNELSLVLAQLVMSCIAMAVLFAAGLCEAPPLNLATFRKSVPLAFWFFVYVISGLGSLRSLTVPTWSALRRLTAIFILVFDYVYDGRKAPGGVLASVIMMLVGGVVAAAGDLDGTWLGYVQVAVNCASSALYLRAINALRRSAGVSEVGALFLTNILCFGPVLAGIYLTDERARVLRFEHFGDAGFRAALFGSAALAGLLNYLVFLSAAVNSPLTTSITGQAKNVVGSLGGYLLLPASAGSFLSRCTSRRAPAPVNCIGAAALNPIH